MPVDHPSVRSHPAVVLSLLRDNTPVSFTAGGPSMNPSIRDGETVSVRPVRPEDLRRGAILLYCASGRLVLHRLIRCDRKTRTCLMTGDAALRGAEEIPDHAVAGVAQWRQRGRNVARLDSRCARLLGQARIALRPLRRLAVALWGLAQRH